jgi:HD-GYP domain-containing protein (c-di-GMP phosphodiesterase class II)
MRQALSLRAVKCFPPAGTRTASDGPTQPHLAAYLPLAVFTTAVTIVAPAALVTLVSPRTGPLAIVASAAGAVALSLIFAGAESAMWKRRRQSRDVVFADLMLWGWLRRWRAERSLSSARRIYESVTSADASIDIGLLTDLSELLEARDAYTHGHGRRVARHAERVARAMHFSATEVAKVRAAAMIHDIGKLHTPRAILNNPGQLDDSEFAVLKLHAADGAQMLGPVGDPELAAMVGHHHERVDGCGYPDGLLGEEIPIGARIISVADTFDAITSNRAYRAAATQKQALDILAAEAGAQLDAEVVAAFLGCYSSRRSVAWCALATSIPQRLLQVLQAGSPSLAAGSGSVLPALGAAGVLALSTGLSHDTSSHAHAALAGTHSPGPLVPRLATSTTRPGDLRRSAAGPRGARRLDSGRSRPRDGAPDSSGAPVPQHSQARAPSTAAGPVSGTPTGVEDGTNEPAGTGPPSPPAQATPGAPPPAPAAPVGEATPIPVPRLPEVRAPTVTTPSVPTPAVTTPSVTIPATGVTVTIPNVTVPSGDRA